MNAVEQACFDKLYQEMQQNLLLQGKRPKTIDAYSRAIRRVADYFDRCPDKLTASESEEVLCRPSGVAFLEYGQTGP